MEYDPHIDIQVPEDVYPPSEDSILLIESLDIREGERILEIGCGSGVVSIHCARYGGIVTSVDINPSAVECTRRNAECNHVNLDVRQSDLFDNVPERFDTVFFNLPYLPVDDEGMLAKAWSGGDDGLGPLPRLLKEVKGHLYEGGSLVVVVSSLMDQEALDSILNGYKVEVKGQLPLFFEKLQVLEIIP